MDRTATQSLEEAVLANEAKSGGYSDAVRVDAIIMTPGQDYTVPDDPAHTAWLGEKITQTFGEQTRVSVFSYLAGLMIGENPYTHTLVIDIPANGTPTIYPGLTTINTEY